MHLGGHDVLLKWLSGILLLQCVNWGTEAVTKILHHMIDGTIRTTYRLIDSVEFIKQDSMNTAAFEVGYIGFIMLEKYRRLVDKYNSTIYSEYRFYLLEFLLLLEDIEVHFFEIEHLRSMLHEVERKYNITTYLDEPFFDKNKLEEEAEALAKKMGGSAPHGDKEGHGKGKGKGKGKKKGKGKGDLPDEFDEWAQTMPVVPTRYWDKDKKRKLKLYKFDKKQYIFNKMNPVTKPKPSPWPIEYGWEIDYHW